MSLPKRDSAYTMAELQAASDKFLEAGKAYWEAMHKAGLGGALAWVEDSEKGLVIFTRGEYRTVLLNNIPEIGPVYHFGGAAGDGREG